MGPPYEAYHYNFRAYRDYLNAHPAWARSLPVYITETDQVGPWEDANRGWVRAAYREIDEWNRGAGHQKIRSLLLYRFCCDQWDITRKGGVIADFRQALDNDYRWTVATGTALDADVVDNESAVGTSFAPGETRAVRVRVRNGTSTGAPGVRLGTGATTTCPGRLLLRRLRERRRRRRAFCAGPLPRREPRLHLQRHRPAGTARPCGW
jgi:hypothetical protein